MKIGIIGAGNVGGTLGRRWARNGHAVTFGARSASSDSLKELLAQAGPTAKVNSVADAARNSDVLLLAVRWQAVEQALVDCGSVAGKIVIDPTLPLLPDFSGLSAGTTTSGGEMVARWAQGAQVVKAFNHMGVEIMADPDFHGAQAAAFYCGDDSAAKNTAGSLIRELGFDAFDVGPLAMARYTEPLGYLWVSLAHRVGLGREIAFDLVRRGNSL
jgi:predicted dinucleotide-binding enzyme